jgi:uncharacterized membrane protein YccC
MLVAAQWWLAAPLIFGIALGSGLIRAIGPGGNSLGINTTVAFLVGLSLGGAGPAWSWAAAYCGGALWTIVVALAFWHLRPYRRLEQEVASAWEAVAALVLTASAPPVGGGTVATMAREQRMTMAHRAARLAVEQARDALGEMRAGTAGPGTTLAQLFVLLNAAARVGAAAVTLYEIESTVGSPATRAAREDALAALRRCCDAVSRGLLAGRGDISLDDFREHLERLAALAQSDAGAKGPLEAERLAFAQALRHLVSADETLHLLFGRRHRLPDLLRLPFAHRRPRGALIGALRAHLDAGSAIFRHAIRVAGVTAIGTAIIVRYELPRGIWLPLTAMVVLQPEYGGTRTRAVERTAGTIAGAVIASLLLATLRGTAAFDVAIAALIFATFLLIRRRYGAAMTFLTPLIILLVGTSSTNPWLDLGDRVAYTLVGAVLALAAAHLVWPQWEHERLPFLLARAIRAERLYVAAVLDALGRAAPAEPAIGALRRQAEIDVGNADAAYQRMLVEPAAKRRRVARRFALVVYIHRLCRHTIALAAHLGAVTAPPAEIAALRRLIEDALEDVAAALAEGRAPAPRPAFDQPLAALRAALGQPAEADAIATVARLLDQIVSDTTALISSCSTDVALDQGLELAPLP